MSHFLNKAWGDLGQLAGGSSVHFESHGGLSKEGFLISEVGDCSIKHGWFPPTLCLPQCGSLQEPMAGFALPARICAPDDLEGQPRSQGRGWGHWTGLSCAPEFTTVNL